MITNAKNCIDLGRKVALRKKDRWWRYWELIDSKYLRICNVIPNWKNLKKRLSRWRDPESQKRTKGKRDAKANFTYDTQLAFSTLNKDTKTEENTSNEDTSIRDRNRIPIERSKEFLRTLNGSCNSLWDLTNEDEEYHRFTIYGFTRWKGTK